MYFASAIAAAQRTGLDLAAIRRHRDVRNRRIFGFAGAMAEDGGVAIGLRELDGVQRFGERTDLVHLHENRIGRAGIDAFLEELHVGHEQIVADQLHFVAELVGEQSSNVFQSLSAQPSSMLTIGYLPQSFDVEIDQFVAAEFLPVLFLNVYVPFLL